MKSWLRVPPREKTRFASVWGKDSEHWELLQTLGWILWVLGHLPSAKLRWHYTHPHLGALCSVFIFTGCSKRRWCTVFISLLGIYTYVLLICTEEIIIWVDIFAAKNWRFGEISKFRFLVHYHLLMMSSNFKDTIAGLDEMLFLLWAAVLQVEPTKNKIK